jgi:hypothetical protein
VGDKIGQHGFQQVLGGLTAFLAHHNHVFTLGRALDPEIPDRDPLVGRLIEIATKLEGLYRHASTHAAGMVIGDRPLDEAMAIVRRAFRAREAVPGGLTHDVRLLRPFPVYVERARGTRKWTADGQGLIDYWMGHGSLILGHGHPRILEAVRAQLERGTHYGACHELEVRWAELVKRLIPSAERVRFTMTGTEATQLALRLARAYTGKPRVV